MRTLALLLACAALPALAQESKETKETKPSARPEERRPLNLKLDNPGSWATVAPQPAPADAKPGLPALGEDARSMPTQIPRSTTKSPFPEDSNPGR